MRFLRACRPIFWAAVRRKRKASVGHDGYGVLRHNHYAGRYPRKLHGYLPFVDFYVVLRLEIVRFYEFAAPLVGGSGNASRDGLIKCRRHSCCAIHTLPVKKATVLTVCQMGSRVEHVRRNAPSVSAELTAGAGVVLRKEDNLCQNQKNWMP